MTGDIRRELGPERASVQVDVADAPSSRVHLELEAGTAVDSVVIALRRDGELFELAERAAPATAEIAGVVSPEWQDDCSNGND